MFPDIILDLYPKDPIHFRSVDHKEKLSFFYYHYFYIYTVIIIIIIIIID